MLEKPKEIDDIQDFPKKLDIEELSIISKRTYERFKKVYGTNISDELIDIITFNYYTECERKNDLAFTRKKLLIRIESINDLLNVLRHAEVRSGFYGFDAYSSKRMRLSLEENGMLDDSYLWKSYLMQQIYDDNAFMVKLLIESGIDLDFEDERGDTPLISSIKQNRYKKQSFDMVQKSNKIIMMILSGGANKDYVTEKGNSALLQAILDLNIEMVTLLIEEGAETEYLRKAGYKKVFLLDVAEQVFRKAESSSDKEIASIIWKLIFRT